MSIYPTSKSFPESHRSQNIEIDGESVPEKYIEDARAAAERFFEKGLPNAQRETIDWTIKSILPAMVHTERTRAAISEDEVLSFLESVSECISSKIAELEKINFSRGYELDSYTYPTVQEFKPIASWLNSLKEKYELYKKKGQFTSDFQEIFQPFINALTRTIYEKALTSRKLQYDQILSNPEHQEFEFNKVITWHHICQLENKPNQPLLELRDLLNLGQNPKIARVPSMEEQEAFRFLLTISEFKKL